MTTIAWDGKTLAADTMSTRCGHIRGKAKKLFRLKDGSICAGAGRYDEVIQGIKYLNGDDPEMEAPDLEDSTLLCVKTDGLVVTIDGEMIETPVWDAVYSIGSGCEFALSAMHLGLDAQRAVKFAAEHDVYTGGEVETLTLEALPQGD